MSPKLSMKNDKAVTTRIPIDTWRYLMKVGPTAGGAIKRVVEATMATYDMGVQTEDISWMVGTYLKLRDQSVDEVTEIIPYHQIDAIMELIPEFLSQPRYRGEKVAIVPAVTLASPEKVELIDIVRSLTVAQLDALVWMAQKGRESKQ